MSPARAASKSASFALTCAAEGLGVCPIAIDAAATVIAVARTDTLFIIESFQSCACGPSRSSCHLDAAGKTPTTDPKNRRRAEQQDTGAHVARSTGRPFTARLGSAPASAIARSDTAQRPVRSAVSPRQAFQALLLHGRGTTSSPGDRPAVFVDDRAMDSPHLGKRRHGGYQEDSRDECDESASDRHRVDYGLSTTSKSLIPNP